MPFPKGYTNPNKQSDRLLNMYDLDKMREALHDIYKQEPLPLSKFAQKVGLPTRIVQRFLLKEGKHPRMESVTKIVNFLERAFPKNTFSRL